jgi:hypothetical protein
VLELDHVFCMVGMDGGVGRRPVQQPTRRRDVDLPRGIDSAEIIDAVRASRPPAIPSTPSLRL